MRKVLQPYVGHEESGTKFVLIRTGTDSADVYLDRDSMLANHISGERLWDVLVRGAQAANWVILPTGCPRMHHLRESTRALAPRSRCKHSPRHDRR